MVRQRHLNNAPIKEALIDISVVIPPSFDVEVFSKLEKRLGEKYITRNIRKDIKGKFDLRKDKPISIESSKITGYAYKSKNDEDVAQFRSDGFTYNRLGKYTNWEEVFGEAKYLWDFYKKLAKPEKVTRIAVRYINHLNIGMSIEDISERISEYIENPPSVPTGIPKVIRKFLNRVTIYDPNTDLMAHITQTLGKNIEQQRITVILDIDVFKEADFDIDNQDIMWGVFKKLHDLKNDIFFNSITEKIITEGKYE